MRCRLKLWTLAVCLGLGGACGDDDPKTPTPGVEQKDSGTPDSGDKPDTGAGNAGEGSEGGSGGKGNPVASKPVTYKVPEKGGSVSVPSPSGMPVDFEFPPNASGMDIKLTPQSAASIGWTDGQFAEVIKLEPDGATFTEPIIVRPPTGDVLVLSFPQGSDKSGAEGLPLAPGGDGFLLSHFSTLVVVTPEKSCGTGSGWKLGSDTESVAKCKNSDFPQYLAFVCKATQFCLKIEASCCAPNGATTCRLGYDNLAVSFAKSSDTRGDLYPWCAPPQAGSGGGAAGQTAGGAGSVASGGTGATSGSSGGEAGQSGGEAGHSGGAAGESSGNAGSSGANAGSSGGAAGESSGSAGSSAGSAGSIVGSAGSSSGGAGSGASTGGRSAPSGDDAGQSYCAPHSERLCYCDGDRPGYQLCSADGDFYLKCQCAPKAGTGGASGQGPTAGTAPAAGKSGGPGPGAAGTGGGGWSPGTGGSWAGGGTGGGWASDGGVREDGGPGGKVCQPFVGQPCWCGNGSGIQHCDPSGEYFNKCECFGGQGGNGPTAGIGAGGSWSPPDQDGGPSNYCEPGMRVPCGCGPNTQGWAYCDPTGTSFNKCDCGWNPGNAGSGGTGGPRAGSGGDWSPDNDAGTEFCKPFSSSECYCANVDGWSKRTCDPTGSYFHECECGFGGGSGGGPGSADAGSAGSAGSSPNGDFCKPPEKRQCQCEPGWFGEQLCLDQPGQGKWSPCLCEPK